MCLAAKNACFKLDPSDTQIRVLTKMAEASGRCACGHIKYKVTGEPTWVAGCCCRDCARATGTPYIVWVGFPVAAVKFQEAEPTLTETSEGVRRGFCGKCGAALTYGRDPKYDVVDPLVYIAATSFDDPDLFPPTEVVWYAQRPDWFELAGPIPLHDGVSPGQSDRAYISALKRQ